MLEFQCGNVWNSDQVRGLFDSLYRRHPVGGLLVWATEAKLASPLIVVGGITSDAEEDELEKLNDWVEAQGLPRGIIGFDFADPVTGEQQAIFDLAWPNGIQEELTASLAINR